MEKSCRKLAPKSSPRPILNFAKYPKTAKTIETLKYWVGVQQGQSYLMGRRCLFRLGWPPF